MHKVQIGVGYNGITLPGEQKLYNAGDTETLTDAQFGLISPRSLSTGVIIDLGGTPDSDMYAPISALTPATLPSPFVTFHRGIPNMVPEETREGLRAAIAAGATSIKVDGQLLSDGVSFGAMHDDTVDRTTSGTGNCADHTVASWQQLVIDSGSWFGGGWGNLVVPLLPSFLDEFGGKVLLWIEAKRQGTAQAMVNLLVAKKLKDSVIFMTSFLPDLAPAVSAGITTCFLDYSSGVTYTPAQLVAAGVTWVGLDYTVAGTTSTLIANLHAAGLKVFGFTMNRQYDAAAFLAKGGDGWHSDDAIYASGAQNGYKYLRTADQFALQSYSYGHLANTPGNRGAFVAPNEWGYAELTSAGFKGSLIGSMCPIKGNPNANTFTINFTVNFLAGVDTARWAGIYFGFNNDLPVNDGAPLQAAANGYRGLLSIAGTLGLYKYTAGATAGTLATTASTALTLPQVVPMTLAVTPTGITLTRTDTGQSVTSTDTSYRGGYFHLGVSGATARFKNITVS